MNRFFSVLAVDVANSYYIMFCYFVFAFFFFNYEFINMFLKQGVACGHAMMGTVACDYMR